MIHLKRLPKCKDKTFLGSIRCRMKYIDNFRKRDFFFSEISLDELSRYFLDDFLDLNVFISQEKDIYTQYEDVFHDTEYPKEKNLFYKYILIHYLDIYSSPYDNFIFLLKKFQIFLKEIIDEIEKLENEIKGYEKNNILTIEDRYHKKHLAYYLEKNYKIKENIIKFISTGIYNEAYGKSTEVCTSGLPIDKLGIKKNKTITLIHKFHKFQPQYIENFNELIYKFGFLARIDINELMNLYENDKKNL